MKTGHFIAVLTAAAIAACAPVRERPEEEAPPAVGAWRPEAVADLVAMAQAAPSHGLPEETAALEEIAVFQQQADANAVAQIDIAADALFSSLARSLALGAADPTEADPHWLIPAPAPPDLVALLARRTAGEAPSTLLQGLAPQSREYGLLREELARVSAEAAGAVDAQGRSREDRLQSLRATLERWRWLPRDLAALRVEARVPQFEVVLFRDGAEAQRHAAIVGARATPTPTFAAEIRTITLNPYWEPPRSILVNELLPRFRRNPSAAARENYEVLDSRGQPVALASVDWAARPFPYRVRQRPGAGNALGRLRFDLPNPHAVYLHDTPSRNLFARDNRALSHGCIRVQNPVDLAAAVLNSPEWDISALSAEIARGVTSTIDLDSPVPIFVLYVTAATAADGTIAYADDIYARDRAVVAAIDAPDVTLATARVEGPLRCPA